MKHCLYKVAVGSAVLVCLMGLTGCFPLLFGGAMTTAFVASDRRTSGMVLEDNNIQLKAGARIGESLGERGHIDVTSYNLRVLLTGEVPTAQDKALVEQIVLNVENVRGVNNELEVMGNSTLAQRSSDVLVSTRVKTMLVDARDLISNAFKVVTERGTVYVMGRVTQREAARATEIIRSADGVQRLVLYWEIISEDDLARMLPKPAPAASEAKGR
jgi:osmotically-inducible protein OsmY